MIDMYVKKIMKDIISFILVPPQNVPIANALRIQYSGDATRFEMDEPSSTWQNTAPYLAISILEEAAEHV